MKRKILVKKYSDEEIDIICNKEIPKWLNENLLFMVEYYIAQMVLQRKLAIFLSKLNYSPFIHTLDQKQFESFIGLIEFLPEKYRFLVPTYNDNEIIKKLINATIYSIDSVDNFDPKIVKAFTVLINTKPDIVVDIVKERLEEFKIKFPINIGIIKRNLIENIPALKLAYQEKEISSSSIDNEKPNSPTKYWQSREAKRVRLSEPKDNSISM